MKYDEIISLLMDLKDSIKEIKEYQSSLNLRIESLENNNDVSILKDDINLQLESLDGRIYNIEIKTNNMEV